MRWSDLSGDELVTYYVMVSPDSSVTPKMLAHRASALPYNVLVKETCYGALVHGKKSDVEKVLEELRSLDPPRIFVKLRGFPPGDPRVCRAKRGGGPRMGFHQQSLEREKLPLIAKALEKLMKGELKPVEEVVERRVVDEKMLKSLVKRVLGEGEK